MIKVIAGDQTVAYINKQDKAADGHIKETPWLLLHVKGRIDRFATMAEARDDARKTWPGVKFKKS